MRWCRRFKQNLSNISLLPTLLLGNKTGWRPSHELDDGVPFGQPAIVVEADDIVEHAIEHHSRVHAEADDGWLLEGLDRLCRKFAGHPRVAVELRVASAMEGLATIFLSHSAQRDEQLPRRHVLEQHRVIRAGLVACT